MTTGGYTIVDCNVTAGMSINGYGQSAEEILSGMDRLGIGKSVLLPVQPKTYHLGPQNDAAVRLMQEHPKKLIGFARIDPRMGEEAENELERCIAKLGLKGLFLHPWEEGYPINAGHVVNLVNRAGRLGIPVLIAAGYPWVASALQIGDLAEKCRDARIVMTHGGQLNISGLGQRDAFTALKDNPNLMMDTCGVYRQDFIEEVLKEMGCRKVLFGSGSPLFNQEFELERAKRAVMCLKKDSDQESVLGGNMLALLGIT